MNTNTTESPQAALEERVESVNLEERWFIDRIASTGESEIVNLQDPKAYLPLIEEYKELTSIEEKLAFFDANPDQFEFPYSTVALRQGAEVSFTFEFLPNLEDREEIYSYNKWFIKNSQKLLDTHRVALRGLPLINGVELLRIFNLKKDRIHLLDEFVDLESKRVKALCDRSFPKRFDLNYSLIVRGVRLITKVHVLDARVWPDLYIWPYAIYIYQLKKYRQAKINKEQQEMKQAIQALQQLLSPTGEPKQKKQRPKKKDLTILQLFRNNKKRLELFITIMKTRNYFTDNGKWNDQLTPGLLLPIIEFLKKGILQKIGSSETGRILELEFGPIMSPRAYRNNNHQFVLDESLEHDLKQLFKL